MILAIDQGTTGTTCLVFDGQAELIGRAYREFEQHFPRPGWVEHDAAEIWEVTQAVAGEALEDAGLRPGELQAVGITNQRETVCVWDPETRGAASPRDRLAGPPDRGPLRRAARAGLEPLVRERTGLVLDPYFSGTKIEWLLANVDGLRERAAQGRAIFGTIDSWLIFKLTGERATDPSNASRTMLLDIASGEWDAELLELFSVPGRARRGCCELWRDRDHAARGAARPPGSGGRSRRRPAGRAVRPGVCRPRAGQEHLRHRFVRSPERGPHAARRRPRAAQHRRVAIGERLTYALEAAIFVTGAAVQWLRDGLGSSPTPPRPRRSRRRLTATTASTSCPR